MFVDRVKIELVAGRGGDGCTSFRREKFVPKGGPDGGDGGRGGSVIIIARGGVNSLAEFANRRMWKAPKGMPGQGSKRNGRRGRDLRLYVPPGTAVIDAEQHFVIKDLLQPGDSLVAARAGKGGWGNTHFKSATNQAPREHTRGEEGERRLVILELKSIADVGLVGKPNAGKSTLLSRLSKARPEIADYPFTTKYPNLGIVRATESRDFVLADIPGLIEGASQGIGLGHEFLRHVERAGVLIHLVEPAPVDGTDPIQNYDTIRSEINTYSADLVGRPEIIAVTKAELPDADAVKQHLQEHLGRNVHLISAVTGAGLRDLLHEVVETLDRTRAAQEEIAARDAPIDHASQTAAKNQPEKRRRLPPHLAGPTAELSDENQPRDFHSSDELE
ncbi:MAG: GTPase ObgE [Pirellulaceae bacterium]